MIMIQQEIRDFKKKVPKSWQDKRILRHLRDCYNLDKQGKNKRTKTALAIYLALTEVASNCQSESFQATYHTIAKHAGVSYSTARRYTTDFQKLGVLKKEYIKQGRANQANRWFLLEFLPMLLGSIQHNKYRLLCPSSIMLSRHSAQNEKQSSVQDNEQD